MVTIRDTRAAGYCSRGVRAFFERYGLDYNSFLEHGIPASKLEATGDQMAISVCEVVRG